MSPLEGAKFDEEKIPLELIPSAALWEMGMVLKYGQKKYGRHNWRKGMAWSRLIGAAMRHLQAFNDGQDRDDESRLSHLGHAMCCLAFLMEYADSHPELDDRYGVEARE